MHARVQRFTTLSVTVLVHWSTTATARTSGHMSSQAKPKDFNVNSQNDHLHNLSDEPTALNQYGYLQDQVVHPQQPKQKEREEDKEKLKRKKKKNKKKKRKKKSKKKKDKN